MDFLQFFDFLPFTLYFKQVREMRTSQLLRLGHIVVASSTLLDIQNGQDLRTIQLKSRPDFTNRKEEQTNDKYRVVFPQPEQFYIDIIINPCGSNETDFDGSGFYESRGYDCCVNHFGRGEYGYMKYHSSFMNGTIAMDFFTASKQRFLAGPNEVSHNMYLVDESGKLIEYTHSRRADDFHLIDDSCHGLRDPEPSCVERRMRAIPSPFTPPCWDHNQTVNSLSGCYSVDGNWSGHCMQVGYAQNAYIHICGGSFAEDNRCGTFIEIHMPNGNPYDGEETVLAETKLTTRETNGMLTTTISLLYKNHPSHLLCAYEETRIRIGSLVKILDISPLCCCPPKYSEVTRTGSFLCPKKRNTRAGPFTDRIDTIAEHLQRDHDLDVYPYCGAVDSNEDVIMCSLETAGWLPSHVKFDLRTGKKYMGSGFYYSRPCDPLQGNYTRLGGLLLEPSSQLGSDHLEGIYTKPCPFGPAFQSCALGDHGCKGNDALYSFAGEIGRVTSISPIHDHRQNLYGVSFNDGRTSYIFPDYVLELQNPTSNYELWFVQRTRNEKILQKRKGFKVIRPACTFDILNDQYLPFTILHDGQVMEVVNVSSYKF